MKRISLLFFCFLFLSTPTYADIRVGTVFFYPPFVLGPIQGFDIDLLRDLCERMKQNCPLYPMEYNKLFSALSEDKIDIVIAAIIITPSRRQRFIFSLPYMLSTGQFLVRKNDPIKTTDELQNKKIGLVFGDRSLFYAYLSNTYDNEIEITLYNDMEDVINALNNGEIAATLLPEETAEYWEENGGNLFRKLGKSFMIGDGMAIMAMPKNAPLIQEINTQLQAMEKDNAYLNLYHTYFSD